jgi:hypothetical protein
LNIISHISHLFKYTLVAKIQIVSLDQMNEHLYAFHAVSSVFLILDGSIVLFKDHLALSLFHWVSLL